MEGDLVLLQNHIMIGVGALGLFDLGVSATIIKDRGPWAGASGYDDWIEVKAVDFPAIAVYGVDANGEMTAGKSQASYVVRIDHEDGMSFEDTFCSTMRSVCAAVVYALTDQERSYLVLAEGTK